MNKIVLENSQKSHGSHKDYEKNLKTAQIFIQNTQNQLLPGMDIKIRDSHHLKNCLCVVVWIPPKSAPMGIYSNPVFMHQSANDFENELSGVFSKIHEIASSFFGRLTDMEISALNSPKIVQRVHSNGLISFRTGSKLYAK